MAKVHLVHGHLDVTDGVVLGEAVEVVDGHHQCLAAQFYVGHLRTAGQRDSAGRRSLVGFKSAKVIHLKVTCVIGDFIF